MKICILTDVGNRGYGHLFRMMTIYETFRNIVKTADLGIFVQMDKALQLDMWDFIIKVEWVDNYEWVYSNLKSADILIIDSYQPSKEFLYKLKELAKLCVFFDDYNRVEYPDGIIVNFSFITDRLFCKKLKNRIYLLGEKYVPINRIFIEKRKKHFSKDTILIILRGVNEKYIKEFISKKTNEYFPFLKTVVLDNSNFTHPEKLAELMNRSLFSISTAGMVMHELVFMGVPVIPLIVSSNQNEGYKKFGIVDKYIDLRKSNWEEEFLSYLANMKYKYDEYKRKAEMGQKIIDGRGAYRIVSEILRVYHGKGFNNRWKPQGHTPDTGL